MPLQVIEPSIILGKLHNVINVVIVFGNITTQKVRKIAVGLLSNSCTY